MDDKRKKVVAMVDILTGVAKSSP